MFFKSQIDVTQRVSDGLLLSHLLSECRTALNNNPVLPSGFFFKTVESEHHALGLPINIHNRARSDLKSVGTIQVDYSQEQPLALWFCVNTDAVLAGISGNSTLSSSARQLELLAPNRSQQHDEIMGLISELMAVGSIKAPPQLFPFCETGSSLSPKLDMPKLENWISLFCETRSSLSAKLFIQIEITNPTTTGHEVTAAIFQHGDGRSRNVENDGTLIPEIAYDIAGIRRGRELQEERERTIATETSPANPEIVQAARNRLQSLKIEMKGIQIGISKRVT